MLDVLIPVAIKLKNIQNEQNMKLVAEEITKVAEEGMLGTKNLIATKGRASFRRKSQRTH